MDVISMRIPNLPVPAINFTFTFRPYLEYIEQQIHETQSSVYRGFLLSIATLIKNSPELLQPITDMKVLDKHKELINLIKITHLSQVKTDGQLYSLGIPSGNPPVIKYFGYSSEFEDFYKEKGESLQLYSTIVGEEFKRNSYKEVLRKGYGINYKEGAPETMVQLYEETEGVKKYYKIQRRHQFIYVTVDGTMPELRQEWVDYAYGTIADHKSLQEPLPFEKFIIEGFFIFTIIPDTEEVALNELNNIITHIHENDKGDTFNRLIQATRSLLGNGHIEIGFLPFMKVNDDYVYHNVFTDISIVLGCLKKHFSPAELEDIFKRVIRQCSSCGSVLDSLGNDIYQEGCGSEDHIQQILIKEGFTSLKFVPVRYKDTLLGVIELGSKNEGDINTDVLRKLEMAMPAYREYFLHKANAFTEYMKSFIMQRYTAIQQSVAWKFNEEVWNTFKNTTGASAMVATPPVRFENLYPFYGAIDFRNSSQKQIEAIHSDYKAQLHFLDSLLLNNETVKDDKTVKELLLQIRYWRNRLCNNIDIEEEVDLRHFLEIDSVNFINTLADSSKLDKETAQNYSHAVLAKEGEFHLFHNKYEESLQKLNRVLKDELFLAEQQLQDNVPHYFEKFQTDGLEYSLYAGQSIKPSVAFPANGVNDIISWQLDTMLKMATTAAKYKEQLTVPLETTQLILVHENTVDISYRIDERHFDVEGSYSIRYEVVKKRIDKVRLLNSNERLTQPGTIAIVYTHKNGIKPYIDKIGQLVKEGKLLQGVEYLDLEQLHGIGKLKAIRVKMAPDAYVIAELSDDNVKMNA